jgi:hypothetical protein
MTDKHDGLFNARTLKMTRKEILAVEKEFHNLCNIEEKPISSYFYY